MNIINMIDQVRFDQINTFFLEPVLNIYRCKNIIQEIHSPYRENSISDIFLLFLRTLVNVLENQIFYKTDKNNNKRALYYFKFHQLLWCYTWRDRRRTVESVSNIGFNLLNSPHIPAFRVGFELSSGKRSQILCLIESIQIIAKIFREIISPTRELVNQPIVVVDTVTSEDRQILDTNSNDPIFSKYVCPISQCPIRFPLKDPTTVQGAGNIYYEKYFIEIYLSNKTTSPVTRLQLSKDQLEYCAREQLEIETRLNEIKVQQPSSA